MSKNTPKILMVTAVLLVIIGTLVYGLVIYYKQDKNYAIIPLESRSFDQKISVLNDKCLLGEQTFYVACQYELGNNVNQYISPPLERGREILIKVNLDKLLNNFTEKELVICLESDAMEMEKIIIPDMPKTYFSNEPKGIFRACSEKMNKANLTQLIFGGRISTIINSPENLLSPITLQFRVFALGAQQKIDSEFLKTGFSAAQEIFSRTIGL